MGLFKNKSKGSPSSMALPINSLLDSVNGMKIPASPNSADTAVTMSGSSFPTTPSTNKKKKKKNIDSDYFILSLPYHQIFFISVSIFNWLLLVRLAGLDE